MIILAFLLSGIASTLLPRPTPVPLMPAKSGIECKTAERQIAHARFRIAQLREAMQCPGYDGDHRRAADEEIATLQDLMATLGHAAQGVPDAP